MCTECELLHTSSVPSADGPRTHSHREYRVFVKYSRLKARACSLLNSSSYDRLFGFSPADIDSSIPYLGKWNQVARSSKGSFRARTSHPHVLAGVWKRPLFL